KLRYARKMVMTTALKDVPVTDFPKPEDIISVSIDSKSGLLPSSLTPGRYIKTELFAKNNVPTKHSDVWKIVEIDPSTNLLANKYCPERTKRAMLIPPESSGDYRNSEDGRLYAPSRTCNVHDPNNSQPVGQIGVIICTDERHEDNKFLANIPQDNSSGGCPESLRQLQYFNEDQVPKEHCSLKDHAINENIVIGPEDEGKDTGKDEKPDKNNPTTLNAPSSLKFSTKGSSCNLSWKSSNPSSTTYVIERITNSDQDTKVKFSTNSLSYTDSGLEKGSSYRYRVYAYNAENDIISQWSKSVTVAP
ncbi:MAG: fibronectin type III domain-containing protein, partial [Clostridiales bacterium]